MHVFKLFLECPAMKFGTSSCSQSCSCVVGQTAWCNNFNGKCSCNKGWTSNTCAVDVDECDQSMPDPCQDYEVCTNTQGSRRCDCERGLQRDPSTGKCTSGMGLLKNIILILFLLLLLFSEFVKILKYADVV